MIKLMPTKTDFKEFLTVTTPAVDAYVQWAGQSLAYDYYCHGKHQAMLERAHQCLGQYFNKWAPSSELGAYQCNDGRREGGGVTGPVCHFGTMPCYFSIRFWTNQLRVEIYRAVQDQPHCNWRPGDRLYNVTVWTGEDVFANEECFFGNILNR
jgi:hypothetical protein